MLKTIEGSHGSLIPRPLPIIFRRLAGALLLIAMIWAPGPAAAEGFVTQESLTQTLQSRNIDAIVTAMNQIKRQHYKGEILPFIADLWSIDRAAYPDLPWDLIKEPPVRLEVAGILVQAKRNGYIDMDISPMLSLARDQVRDSKTPQDVVSAMIVLSYIQDPDDIPLLTEIAKQENKITFRMSVIAITEMCEDEPREAALDDIADGLASGIFRNFLENLRHEMALRPRTGCEW